MTTESLRKFADALVPLINETADLALQMNAIVKAAEAEGINPRALKKVAKEMTMESDKLRKQYEEEEQLDMFRGELGLLKQKGLFDGLDGVSVSMGKYAGAAAE